MIAPSLSIVTPVFNAERYIAETVRSVVDDMSAGDQYIVVDDGSADNTSEVLRSFGDCITVLRQANAGEAAAVNVGVAACSADIVGVVNADDPVLPGLLEAVRAAFAADPTLAAVYPDWIKIDAAGRRLAAIETCEFDYDVLLAQHMCIPGPGAFFRKSMLGQEPVRDDRARGLSDYDFWLRFGRQGANIKRIPTTLATWRLHDAGTTITAQGAQLAATKINVIERLLARPDLPQPIRRLGPRALSAAYYQAALVGLRATDVPSLRYAIASYRHAPRWPAEVLSHQQRSLPHLAYASLQPLTGIVHGWAGPFLPPRFRRSAVLGQTFGIDVQPHR